MESSKKTHFNQTLRELRGKLKQSQQKTSDELGITKVAYQNYETGKSKPNYDALVALADYFDVSIDYLVGRTDNPEINR